MTTRGPAGESVPLATYRLQLHAGFTFEDARRVLPYLQTLGISHLYLSPIFQATPGSAHGYDVVDPTRLNAELGGEVGFASLVDDAHAIGLRLVIDIVPNHMGTSGGANEWWEDVLRRGRASPHARVFDIDWEAGEASERGRMLLPVLGDDLEHVVERGELRVHVGAERRADQDGDGDRGEGELRYFDRAFPLAPGSLGAAGIDEGGDAGEVTPTPDRLRALLDAQHYVLAYWRSAKPRVNFRRFFTVDELVGVRQEDPGVFAATHARLLELLGEGRVDGLRIDHIDGLADPEAYLAELAGAARQAGAAPYVVVEKILGQEEQLPGAWSCQGTTGYDLMTDLGGVLTHGQGMAAVVDTYRTFTGLEQSYAAIAYACRRRVIEESLDGQIGRLAESLRATLPAGADIAPAGFAEALKALLACLPVYRTYTRVDALDPGAEDVVEAARRAVADHEPTASPEALDAIAGILAAPPPGPARAAVMRLQQLMPAVQAKGLEDMAFYRYTPLASLCEVGGEPDASGLSVEGFHGANRRRAERWPSSMLATATHDHKRGEDTRARLHVVSEIPDEWTAAVERWAALAAGLRRDGEPSRQDEYLLYQTLLAIWPPEPLSSGEAAVADIDARLRAYAVKAAREAAQRTSWVEPDERYEAALQSYVTGLVRTPAGAGFRADFEPFARRVARDAVPVSLAQLLLRLTAPGVPDTYQGTELWDLSLVDPDNRRPVDYGRREAVLATLEPALGAARTDPASGSEAERIAARLLDEWPTGEVKLFVLAAVLRLRARRQELFRAGGYEPLPAIGARAEHVIAFARVTGEDALAIVVPRFPATLRAPGAGELQVWAPAWGDTRLPLPAGPWTERASVRDALTGRSLAVAAGSVALADALGPFPIAVLDLP